MQRQRGTKVAKVSEPIPGTVGRSLPAPERGLRGLTRERPGAEGPERIAPPEQPPQGDSAIPPGSIRSGALPGGGILLCLG
jgi:hypothetical protein